LVAGSAARFAATTSFLAKFNVKLRLKQMPAISLLGDSERCVCADVLRLKTSWQTVTRGAPDTIQWPPSEVPIILILNSVQILIKFLHVTVKAGLQFECPSSRIRGFPRHIQYFTEKIQHF